MHSAKFNDEQEAENIREAMGRHEISHPVVADMNNHLVKVFDLDRKVLRTVLVKKRLGVSVPLYNRAT